MKICSNPKCKQANPQSFSEFYKQKGRGDGLRSHCKSCISEYKKTPEGRAADRKYREDPEIKAKKKEYDQTPERKAIMEKYNQSPEGKAAKKAWEQSPEGKATKKTYAKSPEGKANHKTAQKEYLQTPKGRAKNNALSAKHHAAKIQATPPWSIKEHLKEIEGFYIEAIRLTIETGIKHHVDHIVPLQGKTVTGLHVPWNLQVLTAEQNQSKGNTVTI